jgi:hypothetical protein
MEVLAIAGLYLAGELSRGLASSGEAGAERNAAAVVRLERHLHLFGETAVQDAAHRVFGLPAVLGYAYLTLHLAVTASVLVWVYRHRRFAYPRLRNTLAVASGLAVVGYALFPTAPPRLANVGVADTVSGATSINLTSRLVSTFYNPYAAVPSMHIGFALIVGVALWRLARRRVWRLAGIAYPVLILFVIVATGNHFFLDAAAGALTGVVAAGGVAAAGSLEVGVRARLASRYSGARIRRASRGGQPRSTSSIAAWRSSRVSFAASAASSTGNPALRSWLRRHSTTWGSQQAAWPPAVRLPALMPGLRPRPGRVLPSVRTRRGHDTHP